MIYGVGMMVAGASVGMTIGVPAGGKVTGAVVGGGEVGQTDTGSASGNDVIQANPVPSNPSSNTIPRIFMGLIQAVCQVPAAM